jgi:hypothetical protein
MLAIRGPLPEAESRYVTSVNLSVTSLRNLIDQLNTVAATLPNRDLDTGRLVVPGAYRLTDQTYAQLLKRITRDPAATVPAGLQRDVLAYYADPAVHITTEDEPKAWAQVQQELTILRGMHTRPEPV